MKRIILLLIITLFSIQISCTTSATSGDLVNTETQDTSIASNIDASEFNKFLTTKENAILLDVRTKGEVAQGYIEGSVNIDFSSASFQSDLGKLDKNSPILVYCKSGRRSASTMNYLSENGFKEVYNLSGGIIAWQQAGLNISK